jgi:hypothetical protein
MVTEKFGTWDEGEWFAVIMPMKGGEGLKVTMPRIYMEDLEKFNSTDKTNVQPIRRDA